jgi:glucosamine--fructose-6-phosphate aminotransferase (isomerizing)
MATVIEGAYLGDLLDQPKALADTLAGLVPLPRVDGFDRIVLTGMGGSFQILHPLYLKLTAHGFHVLTAETSELIYSMPRVLDARTLLVAVSQSGRSAETVRLLGNPGRRPKIIGVTNTPSSPLALAADVTVMTYAGPEFSVSSKTTVTSLMALEWLGDNLCSADLTATRSRLEQAAPAAAGYLARWRDHVGALSEELAGIRHLFIAGRGTSLAAVGLGGMIMKEAAHFHSEGMSSAAFRHGPLEMLGPDCYMLVFEGDPATAPLNRALVDDICQAGARAALAGVSARMDALRLPEVPGEIRPIIEMLPLQMISLALAALAGREAGVFERITKVTTTE